MTFSRVTMKDFRNLAKYHKLGSVLLIPILMLPVAWYRVVAGFMLMHLTGGLILATIFQSAHVVPSSEFPLPDEANNEMSNNWVVHHLFPNISHVHYRKLAPIVQSTAQKYGLPCFVNPTFVVAVKEHVRMLRILGREAA